MKPEPYYDRDGITIYHGDCLEILPHLTADVVVTDPPYGIGYRSGHDGELAREIAGDEDVRLRDFALGLGLPTACFATWRCSPPSPPKGQLIWKKNAGGMGDLTFPWKTDYEVCWIFGVGWSGHRGSSVLTASTVPTWNSGKAKRVHPHEKPVDLLQQIVAKAPPGTILDPFMGSGTTLVAAKLEGRKAIGIELEERYCEIAVKRLAQGVLDFG